MIQKVHVKVPATSANMGSGFDAVGIALTLYNEIIFEEANLNPDETKRGEGGHGSTGK